MSKYLNESQKANEWALNREPSQQLDVEQALGGVKQRFSSRAGVSTLTLQNCSQIDFADRNNLHLVHEADSSNHAAAEAYRALRTKLMRLNKEFATQTIAVTSTTQGEGKTLTTANLGLCYSQLREFRVLLIDADLRTSGLSRLFDKPGEIGLAKVLQGTATAGEAIRATPEKNLYVMPAGLISTPPPELFTGMRWQELLALCSERFNIVLIDTPPVTPLSDFELISAACHGILMVVRAHHCQPERLEHTVEMLDKKKLLGIAYNASDETMKDYYGGYGYGAPAANLA